MTPVWALMIKKTGELLHQEPDTVDVWLVKDWPYHICHSKTKDELIIACGHVKEGTPMKRTRQAATWPYTVNEVDFTLDHTERPQGEGP